MKFAKYPSIENLYRATDILQCKCVITEKLHGTNVRFMYDPDNGGLVLGSRENVIYKDGYRAGELYGFTDYALKNVELYLKERPKYHKYVFYGEFYGSSIQKGVKYAEEKEMRVFDIRDPNEDFLDWDKVMQACEDIGFKYVPVIDIGVFDISYLESIRDNISFVGKLNGFTDENNIGEGIVLKPVKMQRNRQGEWWMAKYKSEKWAENAKAPKVKSVDPAKLEAVEKAREFAKQVVTMGRVSTIIDHITRNGNSELDMKRTPEFVRELVADVMKEHASVYEGMSKNDINLYNKEVSNVGVAEWKKEVMKI